MHITRTTDYAIRVVMLLAITNEVTSAKAIGEEMKIPKQYLPKITKKLKEKGILGAKEGSRGGFYLLNPTDEITLADIIYTMEQRTYINLCLDENEGCSRDAINSCSVHKFYGELQTYIDEQLESMTIKKLTGM